MSLSEEWGRLNWRIRTWRDFARPRPAVFGWFSTHNLGDDSALYALQKLFVDEPLVITPQTYRIIPRNLKALVVGAGGCINQATAAHVLKYMRPRPQRRFPCAMISAGVNRDYGDEDFLSNKELLKKFLAQFDFLSVRDRLSQRFLEDLGFPDAVLIPDLVLTLPKPALVYNGLPARKDKAGLVLASNNATFQKERDSIFRFLVETCDHVISTGREIVCIPFQVDSSSSGRKQHSEVVLARAIRERLAHPEEFILIETMPGPVETLDLIERELRYMLSMRLHGNVFAARAGVPFLSLSYNEKHDGFLEMTGMQDFQIVLRAGEFGLPLMKERIAEIEGRHLEIVAKIRQQTAALQAQVRDGLQKFQRSCPAFAGSLKVDRGESQCA